MDSSSSDDVELEVVFVKLAMAMYKPHEEHLQRRMKRLSLSEDSENANEKEKLLQHTNEPVVKMEEAEANCTKATSIASKETGRKRARELSRRDKRNKSGGGMLKRLRKSGDCSGSKQKEEGVEDVPGEARKETPSLREPNEAHSDVGMKEKDFPFNAYSADGMSNFSDEERMKTVRERVVEVEKRAVEAELTTVRCEREAELEKRELEVQLSRTLAAIKEITATPVLHPSSIDHDVQGSQSLASLGLRGTEGPSSPPSAASPEPLVDLSVSVPAHNDGKSPLTTVDSADVEIIYAKISSTHKRKAHELNQGYKKKQRGGKLKLLAGSGDSESQEGEKEEATQKELEQLPLFRPIEPQPSDVVKEEDFPFKAYSAKEMSNIHDDERMKAARERAIDLAKRQETELVVSRMLAAFKEMTAKPVSRPNSVNSGDHAQGSQSALASWGPRETSGGNSSAPSTDTAPPSLGHLSFSMPTHDFGKGSQSAPSSWGLREKTRGHANPPSADNDPASLFDLSVSMMAHYDGDVPFLTQLTNRLSIPAYSLPSLPSLTLSSSSAPNCDVDLKANFKPGDNLLLRHVASHSASGPLGCAFDLALKMWLVADSGNNKVVLLNYDGNRLHSIGGFVNPSAIAVLVPGAEYAVLDDYVIWSIDLISGTRTPLIPIGPGYRGLCVVSGGYLATLHTNSARLCILNRFSCHLLDSVHLSLPEHGTSRPSFLCARGDMVYITDLEANVLRTVRVKEANSRIECSIVACCDLKKDAKTSFSFMSGIFADSCHTVFVCDARNRRAFLMSPTGAVLASVLISQGSGRPFFPYTSGLAISPQLRVMLCGRHSHEVSLFDIDVQRCERSQVEKDLENIEKTIEFGGMI